MYDELVQLRKKQKNYKSDLEGKFKVLRQDFDEWRKQEPPVVLPNPNLHLYEKARDESSSKKVVMKSPPSSQRDASTTEQKIAKLRADLPELRPGEEVLAKWPDDGWYYRSIVKEYLGKYRYQVEDSLRDVEQIYREDIVSELHDVSDTFEVREYSYVNLFIAIWSNNYLSFNRKVIQWLLYTRNMTLAMRQDKSFVSRAT